TDGLADGVVRRNPTYRTALRPSRRNVGSRRAEAAAPFTGPCPPPRRELLQLHRDRLPLLVDPHEEEPERSRRAGIPARVHLPGSEVGGFPGRHGDRRLSLHLP